MSVMPHMNTETRLISIISRQAIHINVSMEDVRNETYSRS